MHGIRRTRRLLSAVLPLALAASLGLGQGAAVAATTNSDQSALEVANAELSGKAALEGMVLLENHNHALPLTKGNIAVFGVGSYQTVKGGTGSGAVNNRYSVNVRDGLTNAGFTITTSDAYYQAMKTAYDTKYPSGTGGGAFGGGIDYASVEQQLTRTTVKPTAPTDNAIFVVARNSGEGADRKSTAGDYLLTETELNDIQLIGQTYANVSVVLNVGGVVDTAFYGQINKAANDPNGDLPIDGLLLMSQLGQEGGNALASVLTGDVSPSGKRSTPGRPTTRCTRLRPPSPRPTATH